MIVLVAAVLILWFGVPGMEGEGIGAVKAFVSGSGGAKNDPGGQSGSGKGDTAGDPAPGSDLWYYDASRAPRYEAFAAERPDLDFSDVVWMVNVDLDTLPYEDVNPAKNQSSITVLVNKFFYLSQDYSPEGLVNIGKSMMRTDAAEAMNEMIDTAAGEGHRLWVQSGFRSFSIQADLYNKYSATDGQEAADRYSARAGHSEHQTGLVADLNTITDAFGETPEGKWVADNCWYFGFIVRYNAANTAITLFKPEPWHIRYIGREAAAGMHDLGIKSFEEYWVKYINN